MILSSSGDGVGAGVVDEDDAAGSESEMVVGSISIASPFDSSFSPAPDDDDCAISPEDL
jgi:hypothetical protein